MLLHFSFFGAVVGVVRGGIPRLSQLAYMHLATAIAIRAAWMPPLSAPELRREKNLASHHHHHHDAISTAP